MTDPNSPLPPADSDLPPAPAAAATSRWEDFIDIFYAPSAVYERRAASGFGLPMLVVTVVGTVIFFATFNAMGPVFDAEFARNAEAAIKKGAKPEQMEAMRGMGETMIKVMAVIAPPVLMFLTGLALWLCGKAVGARQTLNAAIMVVAYAWVPRLLGGLLSGMQALMMDPAALNSRHVVGFSPARFLDPDAASPVLLVLASRLDLFTLWATALLAIGLAVTGRIPRGRAAIAAGFVWLIGSLPELVGAARQ